MTKPINILISTGAGISAESGIHTYRDKGGLWTKHNPEEVSHIKGWNKDPQKVLDFKNELRRQFQAGDYQPNAAHLALARLEREWTHGDVSIVTQNIDGLHQKAGSKSVYPIHGSAADKFCMSCGHVSPYDADIVLADPCVNCGKSATTRPYVVMFGEMPCHLDTIEQKLEQCSILCVIGSSLEVMPGNLFVHEATRVGAETVLINRDPPTYGAERAYQTVIYGPAATEVPKWVDGLLARFPVKDKA